MKIRMIFRFVGLALMLAFFIPLTGICAPAASDTRKISMGVVYRAVVAAGKYDDLKKNLPPGTILEKSMDGQTGYVIREFRPRTAEQLKQYMGVTDETELTDAQKGLLESFAFANSDLVKNFRKYFPYPTATLTVQLNDTTGFDDTEKYPSVDRDFWPRNCRQYTTWDGKAWGADFTIIMSPVVAKGMGSEVAPLMKSIIAHELAHSLDLTEVETDGYGPDGAHYFNEVLREKAAFCEAFANFNQFTVTPEFIDRYKASLEKVRIEESNASYAIIDASDPRISANDLVRIEGVGTMIFLRMAAEIPDGRSKILEAFKGCNNKDNNFSRFLKFFLKQYPESAGTVAAILDQQTLRKFTNDQLRTFLGNSPGLDEYLATRPEPEAVSGGAPGTPSSSGSTDTTNTRAYSDLLPQEMKPGMPATIRPVQTDNDTSDPFSDD